MIETHYVMEDGSTAHPRDVKRDAKGGLRHKDGRSVAMRGNVPRSRSVDTEAPKASAKMTEAKVETDDLGPEAPKADEDAKEMKPQTGRRYRTRESKAD